MSNLVALRERADWTTSELAKAAGINEGTLWRIENGRRGCTAVTLRAIAEALDTRLDDPLGSILTQLTEA